jgi:hypothetical protein
MPENAIKKQQTLPTADEVLQGSVRVRPSQLAKLFCVSKQAVSMWLSKGTISSYPDGSINPAVAAREYINHTDPNRVKVSVFKFLTDDVGVLKSQLEKLTGEIAEQKKYVERLLDAFDTIIEVIRDDAPEGEFDYLNSLTDRLAIEKELTEIMNFDFNNIDLSHLGVTA